MPKRVELERWIKTLKDLLEPAPDNHIGGLVHIMANSMAMRQGQTQQMASRNDGWLMACGSLPADLWTEGVMELLKTKTFMPSPGELMAIVGRKFEERRRMLKRAQSLLGEDKQDSGKPFEPEPRVVRLRNMVASYRKHGFADRAAKMEIELAAVEGREPEDWIRAAQAEPMVDMRDTAPVAPPSPEMRAALNVAVAQRHRAQGRDAYADRLERQAVELGYTPPVSDEPPAPDDVPEAMEAE